MHELLKRYISINTTLTNEQADIVLAHFVSTKTKRNTTLLQQGNICDRLYFVNKGCIRVYYLNEQGQERTRYFAFEGSVGTSLAGFISGEPSFELIDTQEDAELLYIQRAQFFDLVDAIPAWKDFYCRLLEFGYIFNNKKMESLITLNARQRYELLLEQHPQIFQRISNKVIASYIDVSQETLSRLKSQ